MKHTLQHLTALTLTLVPALFACSCKPEIPPFSIGTDMSFIPQYESRGMIFTDWNGLTGEALENALYEYTHHVLTTLKEAGAALMGLYKAGQRAAREIFPEGKADPSVLRIYRKMAATYKKIPPQEIPLPKRDLNFDRPIVGADISWVPEQENRGTVFSDNGVEKDVMEILADNGFNWVRLRLFVDPAAENGYSPQGYCGLEKTLEMAKRTKKAGLNLLLNFHYSDNWADPGKQYTPASWSNYTGPALEGQVYRYTFEVIRRFMEEGVCPNMVQTGNEINHGMLWPQGKIEDSYMHFCVLLRCATAAVRAANPHIPVMVHIACGGQNEESVYFFDKILSRDVKFDIIGQSYYPRWHGTLEELQQNLNDLAVRYNKPVIVVEYQEHRLEVNQIVYDIPGDMGLGTFIWEATSPGWGNLFDERGATNENMKIYREVVNLKVCSPGGSL